MLTPAPIYQSLTRPLQQSGGERNYAILVIGGTCLLGVLGWYFRSIACAVSAAALYSGGMLFLRRAAKSDPHMIAAAQRFYGYRRFYPARSAPAQPMSAVTRAKLAAGGLLVLALLAWWFV